MDTTLRSVAGVAGFPELDTAAHGLVQVHVQERGGPVLVTHREPISSVALGDLPELMAAGQEVFE